MPVLHIAAEATVAAVLVVSVLRAFFGRPPRRGDRLAAAGWMLAGLMLMATTVVVGAGPDGPARLWRLLLVVAAVQAVCVAGWWLRGADREDGDEPEDGDDPADGPDGPPIDWDAFDTQRAGWSRPRQLI